MSQELTDESNRIAREMAAIFDKKWGESSQSVGGITVTLETFLAMAMATITVKSKAKDPIKFATEMSEEMVTESHIRVIKFLKEKGIAP